MPPRKVTSAVPTGSPSKRKARVVSDSSVEFIDVPTPSRPKKRQANSKTKPTKGDRTLYDTFPMDSINDQLDALLGQKEEAADIAVGESDTPRRPSRTRTKTEKGKLLEESIIPPKGKSSPKPKPKVKAQDSDEFPHTPSPSRAFDKPSVKKPTPKSSGKRRVSPESASPGNAVGGSVDGEDESPEDMVDDENADKVEVLNREHQRSRSDSETNQPRLGLYHVDDDSADEDNGTTTYSETPEDEDKIDPDVVMCKALQDPALYRIYDNLPRLGPFRDAHAFKPIGTVQRVQFTAFVEGYPNAQSSMNFVNGLRFVSTDHFVNTSRADPALLSAYSDRIVMAGGKTNMVGIMLGALKECYIVREYRAGSSTNPYIIHRVTIVPLPQEIRRDSTVWGQVLGYNKIVSSMSSDGISFHTHPQANSAILASPQTPVKSRPGYFMTAPSPSASTSRSEAGVSRTTFPGSRVFEDHIPIYDGCGKTGRQFTFSDTDFRELHTFPLYRGGREDVMSESIVAVGYTVNLFSRTVAGVAANQLSTNLQFLILLGMTIPEV
ncbi:hypothetical protein BD779DRAFT_1676827 [Infundibulicybe gibba]|nr:hypothetical protein BD779DRAFT_1676827 [Infundibulicybe gibba]